MGMEFDVLPGPSLPERARTALARAATATVSDATLPGGPALAGPVPVRATRDGSPLLLPAAGSALAHWLAERPDAVRVSLPAGAPFSALRLTGTATPVTEAAAAGVTACRVTIGSVEFTGGGQPRVPVEEYQAARPDPLWRVAPGILHHLEHGHASELVRCVRAHGMVRAEWVIPRGLDRYGLELLVLTGDGIAAVRLSFPGGPVAALDDVPMSLRAALTCRCQSGPGHGRGSGHGHGTCEGRRSSRRPD
jgi:hypothetical protein